MPKRSRSMKKESEVVAEGWIYLPYRVVKAKDLDTQTEGYLWEAPHPAMDKRHGTWWDHDWTIFETIEDAQNDIIRRYL